MIRRLLPFAAVLGLAAGGFALAHDGGPGGPGARGPKGPLAPAMRSIPTLDLNATQQAAFDELKETLKANRPSPEDFEARRAERPDFGGDREARKAACLERHAKRDAVAATFEVELGKAKPDAELLHGLIAEGPRGEAPPHAHTNLDALLSFQSTLSAKQRSAWSSGIAESRAKQQARMEAQDGMCEGRGEGPERSRGGRGGGPRFE